MKKSNLYGLIALVLTFVMIFSVMVSASAAGSLTTQEIDQILNTTTDTSLTSNAVTEAVAKVYDSVVLVRNYTVTGVVWAELNLYAETVEDYVIMMDEDDIFQPNKLYSVF